MGEEAEHLKNTDEWLANRDFEIDEHNAKLRAKEDQRRAKKAEKRLTAYELGQEWSALISLVNELTDPETGETRELTDAEKAYLLEQADKISGDIHTKINGICKVFKNIKMEADIAEAEKNTLKGELDRLSKRAKARENEADRVKGLACMLLDKIGEKKMKTELFTVYYQATKKSAKPVDSIFNADLIPAEFLKRELSPAAINKAIEEGRLYEKTENPLDRGKLFDRDRGGEVLKGVFYGGGETLVIR